MVGLEQKYRRRRGLSVTHVQRVMGWLWPALVAAGATIGCGQRSAPPRTTVHQSPAKVEDLNLSTATAAGHIDSGTTGVALEDTSTTTGGEQAPEGYGDVVFPHPIPSADQRTLHALAGFEVVAVYAEPSAESTRLGYLRIGTRMQVTEKIAGPGCPKGWHGLDGGGYACASRGLVVGDKPPYMHRPPPAAARDEALPYAYAYVRQWNTPMWWRLPTASELEIARERREEREVERAQVEAAADGDGQPRKNPAVKPEIPPRPDSPAPPAASPPSGATPTPPSGATPTPPSGATPTPSASADAGSKAETTDRPPKSATTGAGSPPPAAENEKPKGDATPPTTPAPPPGAAPDPAADTDELAPVEPIKLPLNPDNPWLEKGFFLSIGERVREAGKTWWRTARGAYVETKAAYEYKPREFHGHRLNDELKFPVAFAMRKETKAYRLDPQDKLEMIDRLEWRTLLNVAEEVEIRGRTYVRTVDDVFVATKDVRIPEQRPLPSGLRPWEKWIDVSLGQQILVAYEGWEPVFVSLISTGKKGTAEESFETPTGRWRIRSKHVSTTMDGNTASDGNYSIQDVPWAMFFEGSYALHGAFWHEGFGYVRSHGCVNLGPSAAQWLFQWTTPNVPPQWHGVHAQDAFPGTTVIVRR